MTDTQIQTDEMKKKAAEEMEAKKKAEAAKVTPPKVG